VHIVTFWSDEKYLEMGGVMAAQHHNVINATEWDT
jgi:hypothetical protein